jgi:tetratricopeptide (TPR) repeat protein
METAAPNRPFTVNERFQVRLLLQGVPSTNVEVTEPNYPSILEAVEGPSVSTRLVDTGGEERRDAVATVTLRALAPGRAVLPPFTVRSNGVVLEGTRKLIEVSERGAPERVPFNVSWQIGSDPVYQGKTVGLSLEMRLVPSFTYPNSIDISAPETGLFAEVQGLGSASSITFNDQTYFSYPVATFLFTPSQSGTVVIPSATVRALGYTRSAPPLELIVEQVPEEISQTGAIGDLSFDASLSPQRVGAGERVTLELTAQGTGNLTFLEFPTPETDGLVVTETADEERIDPAASGYTGRRTRRIELSPTETGTVSVTVPAFSWWDPETEAVRTEPSHHFDIAVGRAVEPQAESPIADLELLDADAVRRIEPLNLFSTPSAYGLFLPAFFAVVVVALYRRFGRPKAVTFFALLALIGAGIPPSVPEPEIARGVEAYRDGDAAAARTAFEAALEDQPDSPGIRYNLALATFAAGHEGEAVYYLRTALHAKPRFARAEAALARIEGELGLDRQFERRRLVHPDVFFFVALGLFYLLCALLIVPRRYKRGFYFVFAIMLAILFAVSVVGIRFTATRQAAPVAVIQAEDSVLRRIPQQDAATWLNLPEGTAVRVEGEHARYYLIATDYGVQGWVDREKVRIGSIREPTM